MSTLDMIRLKNGEEISRAEFDGFVQNLHELYKRDLVAFYQLVRLWRNPEYVVPEKIAYGSEYFAVRSNCRSVLQCSRLPLSFDRYGRGRLYDPLGGILQTVIYNSSMGPEIISPY